VRELTKLIPDLDEGALKMPLYRSKMKLDTIFAKPALSLSKSFRKGLGMLSFVCLCSVTFPACDTDADSLGIEAKVEAGGNEPLIASFEPDVLGLQLLWVESYQLFDQNEDGELSYLVQTGNVLSPEDWLLLADEIEGFEEVYQEGIRYLIEVNISEDLESFNYQYERIVIEEDLLSPQASDLIPEII